MRPTAAANGSGASSGGSARPCRPEGCWSSTSRRPDGAARRGAPSPRRRTGPLCLETAEDGVSPVLTRRIVVFRRVDGGYRRGDEVHRLHLYEPADILRELGEAGFEARALPSYGRLRFRRGHVGFA